MGKKHTYWYRLEKGLCGSCGKRPAREGKTRCEVCAQSQAVEQSADPARLERKRRYREMLKREVMAHYSGGTPACACCGEAGLVFLTIDHVNGDGAAHRLEMTGNAKRSGETLYFWLRKNDYPEGFQVLCFNCNHAKGTGDVCPHQLGRLELVS